MPNFTKIFNQKHENKPNHHHRTDLINTQESKVATDVTKQQQQQQQRGMKKFCQGPSQPNERKKSSQQVVF